MKFQRKNSSRTGLDAVDWLISRAGRKKPFISPPRTPRTLAEGPVKSDGRFLREVAPPSDSLECLSLSSISLRTLCTPLPPCHVMLAVAGSVFFPCCFLLGGRGKCGFLQLTCLKSFIFALSAKLILFLTHLSYRIWGKSHNLSETLLHNRDMTRPRIFVMIK